MRILEIPSPPTVEQLIHRFGTAPRAFILDSAQSNDGLGDWSFFGAEPYAEVRGEATGADGLQLLREAMRDQACDPAPQIPFLGGAVGYLGYDYGRRLEQLPEIAVDDRRLPELCFGLYDGIAAFDHCSGRLYLVALGVRAPEASVIKELLERVRTPVPSETEAADFELGPWEWNLSEAEFKKAVERVREWIASGDVYQVNLSRRARCRFAGDAAALYRALRAGNAAPYGAYLDCGGFQLLSTSPEQFLRKRGRTLETRPIKGTRPRGATPEAEEREAAALAASIKDRAELLMIVDLERNDLGRIAEYGSVEVADLYRLERYRRVIHQTARVRARLAEGKDVFDALRALFPGGSITGAPKVRAMEIIEALEPTRRGAYCGAIGYIGFDGEAEFNIAIRTLHLKDGWLDYQVGGGIVWDSEPESELQETADKGRAIRETLDALPRRVSPEES